MEPIELNITLDLDRQLSGEPIRDPDGEWVGSGPTTLEDIVLGAAARELAGRVTRDETRSLARRISDIRDEVIREQIEPLIVEALSEPVQPTNPFGEPTGEATTLRALIAEQATESLKLTNSRGSIRSSDTALTKFIREEVDRALTNELKRGLNEAKAEVMARVKEAGGEVIADTLKRAAGRL